MSTVRPVSVKVFAALTIGATVISAIQTGLRESQVRVSPMGLLITTLVWLPWLGLCIGSYHGRHWARVILMGLSALGLLIWLINFSQVSMAAISKSEFITDSLTWFASLIAVGALFTPASNRWFRTINEARHRS